MILIPERASHWYYPSGQPCHQVPAKSGKGLRDATLRDARELGLLPSVTSILKVIAKPELENWKQEQCIMAALTLPRLENEPTEAFAKRVVEDSQKQGQEAADFGRRIHKGIEGWLLKVPVNDPEIEPYLDAVKDWAEAEVEHVYAAEFVAVNETMGYAGTMDLHCRLRGIGDAVVDFKTQGIKNGKPVFYPEWSAQLAAYARAVHKPGDSMPALVSIVIDSKEPGPIYCEQWGDFEWHWEAFCAARTLWCWLKKYDPSTLQQPCPK